VNPIPVQIFEGRGREIQKLEKSNALTDGEDSEKL
jgi:hypothetical protein